MARRLRLVFDIESDGLIKAIPERGIKQNTLIHCMGAADLDTGDLIYWGPTTPALLAKPGWDKIICEPLEEGYKALAEADLLLAHNGIGYDYLALEMLVPGWVRPKKSWDTMVIAKVVWPYDVLFGPDLERARRGLMPMQLVKRHSLKAWGYRTGTYKQEYSGGFEVWSEDMADYMMDDVRSTVALWRLTEKRLGWADPDNAELVWPELAIEVENEVARIIDRQERVGVHFDRPKATALAAELANEQARLGDALVQTFGSWWAAGPVTTPAREMRRKRDDLPHITKRRFGAKGNELKPYVGPPMEEFSPDAPFTPITWTTFQPSSRDHLGQRLQAVFGWKPKKFGKNGKPTVDETTLEEIPEAVMPKDTRQLILDYFVVSKTLGTLANGKKSWLGLCDENDRIHGRMDTAGAITGRGTHTDPNLSGVPAVLKQKVTRPDGSKVEEPVRGLAGRYGWECKELFIADKGWEFTDTDASSLELIMLGNYMFPLDGGAFSARVCDPSRDPHQEHAELADMLRADAKTTIYLLIFGGGAYKLSLSLTVEEHEELVYLSYRGLPMLLSNLAKRFDQSFVDMLDDNQKARIAKARVVITKLEQNIVGLKDISEKVSQAGARGWLKGLDGRKVHVRKAYASLNTLLQSAGAQAVKLWMVLMHRRLAEHGLTPGVDYEQVMWVHDAMSFTHRPGLGPLFVKLAKETIREAGIMLSLRGELRAEGKTDTNWATTH